MTEPTWSELESGSSAPHAERRLIHSLVRDEAILDMPKPTSLVGGILQTNSLAVLYGPPGSCKSFIALDAALSVATGTPWLGQEVLRGPVLYLAGEDVAGIAQRARAWREVHGSLEGVAWLLEPVQLLAPGMIEELIEVVLDVVPALIVIDTLARCTVGLDENSSQEMGQLVEVLDRLRKQTGSCVLVVHHSGKDSAKGMRGSTALLGAVDTTLEASRNLTGVSLAVRKQKNGPADVSYRFNLQAQGESAVLEHSPTEPGTWRPTILMARVSEYLEEQDRPVSQNQVLLAVRGDSNTKRDAIRHLVREGYVKATDGPNRSQLLESVRAYQGDSE